MDKNGEMVKGKNIESKILHWNLERDVAQTVKLQIELLLNYIVKSVKSKEEGYLLPLKYLLCYAEKSGIQDILGMDATQEKEFASLLRRQIGKANINAP